MRSEGYGSCRVGLSVCHSVILSLTLGAHAPEGYGSWVCLSVCLCVCLLLNISLFQCSFVSQTIGLT